MNNSIKNLFQAAIKSYFHKRYVYLLFTCMCIAHFLMGCYPTDDASSRAFKLYQNRYYDSSAYPEYVKVLYLIKDKDYSILNEKALFLKSILLIKTDYKQAFESGRLGDTKFALITISSVDDKSAILIKIEDIFRLKPEDVLELARIEHDPSRFNGEDNECLVIKEHIELRKKNGEIPNKNALTRGKNRVAT